MYISIEEQRKLFIKCLKYYAKFFVLLFIEAIFLHVTSMHVDESEFWYNMARLAVYLLMFLLCYLIFIPDKIEMAYNHKPEERYATIYSYAIAIFCFVLSFVTMNVAHC